MRILVTGGCGYIGSVLVPYLLDKGYDVLVLDSLIHEFNGLYGIKSPNLKVLNMGITTAARTQPWLYKDADVVVHLAALSGDTICNHHPRRATIINRDSIRRVLDVCDGTFLFTSVCKHSPSIYSTAKVAAEKYVLDYGGTVLRLATVCGVSPRMRLDLIVPQFVIAALTYNCLLVNSKAIHSLIHILDTARAIEFLIHKNTGIWNVGTRNITEYDLALAVANVVLGTTIEAVPHPVYNDTEVSFDKLTDAGFTASRTIYDAIRETRNLITAPNFDITAKEWRNT